MFFRFLSSFSAGLIFGLGLIVSGMINPAKVLNFLDVAGAWDPSLAFVMGAALIVAGVGFRVLKPLPRPLFETAFQWPTATDLDARLVGGAVLFGAGWGLGGFCPGPAITAASLGRAEVFIFLGAMATGIIIWRWLIAPQIMPRAA